MDVDARMATESDSDSDAAAAAAQAGAAVSVPVNGTETPSVSPPPEAAAGAAAPPAAAVAGPRPAPGYTVVDALMDKKEDGPGCRCGHTLTAVPAVGEEGSPGYIGQRLILFGGATALEGNNATPPSSAGSAGIRLAGATADVHCYDVLSNKWTRLTPLGEPPSPRAAHVATAVGTMVVIQGGIGPAGLSAEDLHVLDLTQQRPRWHRVVVQGPGPGPRYGHVMALVGQRFLLTIGGNDGKRPLADVWALDTAAKPYEWRKLEPEGEGPPPCMYATASARSDGLLLLCGGRDTNSVPLSSAYGLAKHRDGRWEWAIAPGVSPSPRYQHAAVFLHQLQFFDTLFWTLYCYQTRPKFIKKDKLAELSGTVRLVNRFCVSNPWPVRGTATLFQNVWYLDKRYKRAGACSKLIFGPETTGLRWTKI